MRPPQTILAPTLAEDLSHDLHPLMERLGSTDGLLLVGSVNASLPLVRVNNLQELRSFLQRYYAQLLAPLELPLICQAYAHASQNQFSELIELDQQLSGEGCFQSFADASQRVGQRQLKRLRPLLDQRGLQRYLRAVDEGQAHGWHTLVYGITLASFSFPLRQGLLNYAEQVLTGFVNSAARQFTFPEEEAEKLLHEICANIPVSIEEALTSKPFLALRVF